MRVLLVNAAPRAADTAGYYRRFLAPMPPITLAYLAAALEQAGVDVRVHEQAQYDGEPQALAADLRRHRPDVVGLSAVTATMPAVEHLAAVVRRAAPEARIVLGNIHADIFAADLLRAGTADVIVHGEGERTIVDLVQTLADSTRSLADVQGISYFEGGDIVHTPPRPYIADLDDLPFPAWHLFPMDHYRLFNFARVREPGVLVLGSRGCPYGCSYCSLKIMGNHRRVRSATSIADEFEHLHDRFGFVQPSFTDAIFPFGKREGLDFAAELIRRGLHRKLVWISETRTDLVDLDLLEALRESGLRRIMFGFEAPGATQLGAVHKTTTAEQNFAAVHAARAAGLQVIGFFMLGMPGDTPDTLQATIDHAIALDIDFAKFTVFVPFPGTPIHEQLIRTNTIDAPHDWRRYTSYPTEATPPNYVPDGLTANDLIQAQKRAYASFYMRPRMAARHLIKLRTLGMRDAFDGLRAVFSNG